MFFRLFSVHIFLMICLRQVLPDLVVSSLHAAARFKSCSGRFADRLTASFPSSLDPLISERCDEARLEKQAINISDLFWLTDARMVRFARYFSTSSDPRSAASASLLIWCSYSVCDHPHSRTKRSQFSTDKSVHNRSVATSPSRSDFSILSAIKA